MLPASSDSMTGTDKHMAREDLDKEETRPFSRLLIHPMRLYVVYSLINPSLIPRAMASQPSEELPAQRDQNPSNRQLSASGCVRARSEENLIEK